MIDVSVVIVNWNVKELLTDCIQSIIDTTKDLSYEIIVIDNASTDGSLQYLNEKFPSITLISNEENLGFAKANNQGFRIAKGKYIYILNPDTIISKNNIQILTSYLETHPHVGAVGPRVVTLDDKIQKSCARKLPTLKKVFFMDILQLKLIPWLGPIIEKNLRYPYNYEVEQEIEAGVGAALMIRKSVLFKIGLFYAEFLHGGEDNFLCHKLKQEGNQLVYIPSTTIIHYTAESVKQSNIRSSVNNCLSNGLYFRLKGGQTQYFLFKFMMRWVYVPPRIISLLMKKILRVVSEREFNDQWSVLLGIFKWEEING